MNRKKITDPEFASLPCVKSSNKNFRNLFEFHLQKAIPGTVLQQRNQKSFRGHISEAIWPQHDTEKLANHCTKTHLFRHEVMHLLLAQVFYSR